MKIRSLLCLIAVASLPGCVIPRLSEPQQIDVAQVVDIVNNTLATTTLDESLLRFDSAEVALETVLKQADSASANFWIITAEASVTDAVTQTLTFKLEKRPSVKKSLAPPPVSEALKRAIENAQSDLAKGLKGKDLQLAQLSAAIKFAVEVTKSGSAGTEIKIVPITIGTKKTVTNSAAHTIKLNFAKPEPGPKTS